MAAENVTCGCGELIELRESADGWATLPDAADVLCRHARCLQAAVEALASPTPRLPFPRRADV
jgi:hypothetical protein